MPQSFEELEIWKIAHALTLKIYQTTLKWPKSELFGLTSQVRRAATSVELNIAEGQSRYHFNDVIHFMHIARASGEEVRCCLMLARDLDEFKLEGSEFEGFNVEYVRLIKGINAFIGSIRKRNQLAD